MILEAFYALGMMLVVAMLGLMVYGGAQWWRQRCAKDAAETTSAEILPGLVAYLEEATAKANAIYTIITEVHDEVLLSYYESTTVLLENLLLLINKVPSLQHDGISLKSASYLAGVVADRTARVYQAYTLAAKGQKYDVQKICNWPLSPNPVIRGCYFCSKPYLDGSFKLVKARIDGKVVKVIACATCAEQLQQQKKIKVLYFRREGRLMHWSEVAEYVPTRDFWTLKSSQVQLKKTSLLLIETSNVEGDS